MENNGENKVAYMFFKLKTNMLQNASNKLKKPKIEKNIIQLNHKQNC